MDSLKIFLHRNVVFRIVPIGSEAEVRRALGKVAPAAGFVIGVEELNRDGLISTMLEFSIFDGPEFTLGCVYWCEVKSIGLPAFAGSWLVDRVTRLSEHSQIIRLEGSAELVTSRRVRQESSEH